MDRITPDVQDGGIADSRSRMEALLAANPEKGSIAAVWAAGSTCNWISASN